VRTRSEGNPLAEGRDHLTRQLAAGSLACMTGTHQQHRTESVIEHEPRRVTD
jgi:hypothetical protein